MIYTISRFFSKISDAFPIVGGGTGALLETSIVRSPFPTWETITATIILAIIGAIIGYMVKIALDCLFKKIHHKSIEKL